MFYELKGLQQLAVC